MKGRGGKTMSNKERRTRIDKFEKRRKNTKLISVLFVVIVFLFISLIGVWFLVEIMKKI